MLETYHSRALDVENFGPLMSEVIKTATNMASTLRALTTTIKVSLARIITRAKICIAPIVSIFGVKMRRIVIFPFWTNPCTIIIMASLVYTYTDVVISFIANWLLNIK